MAGSRVAISLSISNKSQGDTIETKTINPRSCYAVRCADRGYCAGARQETEHPVHHGRSHRLDAAELLPPGLDGRGNTQHRPHRQGGWDVHDLLRRVELHV